MPYRNENSNPLSQLAELYGEVTEHSDGISADVRVSLMLQPDEIDLGDHSLNISIREAYLVLTADGQRTDPNAKHGMRSSVEAVAVKGTTEKTVSASVTNAAAIESLIKGTFSPVDMGLETSLKRSQSREQNRTTSLTERRETEYLHIPVEAIGADRWKVSNEDSKPLRGQYLRETVLCVLTRNTVRPNRKAVQVALKVKPKDVDVQIIRDRRVWGSKNKAKLLGVLATKRLGSVSNGSDEALTLATFEGHYEE